MWTARSLSEDELPTVKLSKLYARISTGKIAYLKFIIEGYGGLAVLSTIDKEEGLVVMAYYPDSRNDLIALLESLKDSISTAP